MYATRLAYIHLTVRHLESAVTFYTRFLDLQVSERFGKTSLLVSSENKAHFELALTEGEPPRSADGVADSPASSGPVTLGFVAASEADFEAAKEFVRLEEVPWKLEDRGFAYVLSLQDPDGNTVELFLDRRKLGGRAFWRGESEPI